MWTTIYDYKTAGLWSLAVLPWLMIFLGIGIWFVVYMVRHRKQEKGCGLTFAALWVLLPAAILFTDGWGRVSRYYRLRRVLAAQQFERTEGPIESLSFYRYNHEADRMDTFRVNGIRFQVEHERLKRLRGHAAALEDGAMVQVDFYENMVLGIRRRP